MNVNETLNEYIKEKGIKPAVIAQKTGISVNIVMKILNNDRKIKADEFIIICTVLKIDPNIFRSQAASR